MTPDQLKILRDRLTRTEGRRNRPYVDTVGKVTIGIGHNLTDKGISDAILESLFLEDISESERNAKSFFPVYNKLDAVRQTVLLDMVFNMGPNKVAQFHDTLSHLERGEFAAAADSMLNSVWAKEVGHRALELAEIIRTGQIVVV